MGGAVELLGIRKIFICIFELKKYLIVFLEIRT